MTIEQSISSVFGDVLNTIANNPNWQSALTRLLADFPLQGQPRSSQTISTDLDNMALSEMSFDEIKTWFLNAFKTIYNFDQNGLVFDTFTISPSSSDPTIIGNLFISGDYNKAGISFELYAIYDYSSISQKSTFTVGTKPVNGVNDFFTEQGETPYSIDKINLQNLAYLMKAVVEETILQLTSQTQRATVYALDAGNFHNPDYLLQFRNALNAKLGRLEPFSTLGKPTGYGFIGNVENVFGNFVVFDLPQYKMGFGLMFPNSAFTVVRQFDYNTTVSGAKVFDKDFVQIKGSFKNIDNKGQPLDAGDFAEIIANYVEKYGQLEPASPFQENEMVWVVAKDGSLKPKVGTFKKYNYDQPSGTGTIKLDFKAKNGDGTFYTHSKTYDYPSNLYDYYTDAQYQRLFAKSGTEGIVDSPYTLVFDKTYHSNPPPVSPLAYAYYGSKAYYNKGSDKEIGIHILNANPAKPPKCPQISGGSAKKWVVANPYNATCILVKQYKKASQPRVETFVAQVHRALGMPAPDMRFHQTHLTSPLVSDAFQPLTSTKMSKIVKQQYSSSSPKINNNAFRNAVDLLIVSTWLVNWDVLGMSGDNSLIDNNGDIQCIDLGGALMFKATGGWKTKSGGWNADWGVDYQTIKANMKKALIQMQTVGNNKQFTGLLSQKIGQDQALEITEKIMMLFHPQYNYIEKLTVWTGLPTQVYSDGYNFEGIKNSGADDLNKKFVTWLQARALALYEIFREI